MKAPHETLPTSQLPAAAWFRERLELVEADVISALQRHWPNVGHQVIAHALVEVTGNICAAIIEAEPAARQDIDTKLGEMRAFVQATPTSGSAA